MTGDVGTWSSSFDDISGYYTLIFKGPLGPLVFKGSEEACATQLAEWMERYAPDRKSLKVPKAPSKPLTRDEYMGLLSQRLTDLQDTLKRKNADYTGGDDSPFANFEVTAKLGLSDEKTGVLIRMVDKIQRIRSFIKKGKLEVKNEGVEDAVMDVIGYSCVLLGMLENDRRSGAAKQ